jgi:hypothetical protein
MMYDMDPEYKKRMRVIADKKARMKGRMDPDAQPGFKPRPFLEKNKPTKMIMTKEMRKKSGLKFKPSGDK